MDLITAILLFWVDARKEITALFGKDAWEGYFAHNNTAKLLTVIPFVEGRTAPDRIAFATLVLLFAASKTKSFSGLRLASDFYDRITLLPVFGVRPSPGSVSEVAYMYVARRAAMDMTFDIAAGKYKGHPLLGLLSENDGNRIILSVVETIERNNNEPTIGAEIERLVRALDGDVVGTNTFKTADSAVALNSYW